MKRLLSLLSLFTLFILVGCTPPKAVLKSSAQVLGELEPYYRVSKPTGTGPFPTVIILHGASDFAWYDHFKNVAAKLNTAGFATVFVDSYAGRGISGPALRGGTLLPPERAGDLLVTLDWATRQPWVKQGAVGTLGYSHGAATIMDALILAPPKRKPVGLTDTPSKGITPLSAAVLFYPWCSSDVVGIELTKAYDEDWSVDVPLLAFLPENDMVSDMDICTNTLNRHKAKGLSVTAIDLPGVGHTFDQKTDDHGNPMDVHDAKASEMAYVKTIEFFKAKLK